MDIKLSVYLNSRYLLTPVVIARAVSALATVADTQHAATQVSAVEAEQFLRHQEVASSPPASPHNQCVCFPGGLDGQGYGIKNSSGESHGHHE